MMERARAEAARAFHSTLLAEGVIIQTNALDAAIDAFLAAARADGWKLVSREASEEMMLASRAERPSNDWRENIQRAFAAMWDSAPEVTTAPSPASQPSGK